jgi:hypothetical protein
MGGRGAASGRSVKGALYGTEFSTLLEVSNIKFVRYNGSLSAKAPQETRTRGRVYVTVNAQDDLTSITYYDTEGKRTKTVDLNHAHDRKQPHVHHGYNHSEDGTTGLSPKEIALVDFVRKTWYNRYRKQ